ncbi:MAG TPA: urea ABC transporter ATP-binding subunit UrtE [Syntrophorhabdales bacterium]|nr:urea ABC transporter ATP-binding subunit UrtE [Syntrophorhabdales bacterium]
MVISNITSSYGETVILREIDMDIPEGRVIALMGRNGVGKTTLLKTLMGLIRPLKGKVEYEGSDITYWKPEARSLAGVGYVPQGREIFPYLTVRENLAVGLEARRKKASIPDGIFDLFPGLKDIQHRRGGDLSGGQQQQLAIARILVTEPKLLLLDEPTEGIQPSIVFEIENTIRFIKEQGNLSILLVEQYVEFALRLADFCYIMEKGAIAFRGDVKELSKDDIKNHLAI